MTEFAIRFLLRDVADITPWGPPSDQWLHWFALSDGCNCIEAPQGRLLEMHECAPGLAEPWCDYQVVRLFEDLLEVWPVIAERVPEDIFGLIDADFEAHIDALHASDENDDDDALWEAVAVACEWFRARRVSMAHLASGPKLHLWRVGDTMRLRWVANPGGDPERDHWTVARADCQIAFGDVARGTQEFAEHFLGAMGARVATILREGWTRGDCAIDLDNLQQQQSDREAWAREMLSQEHHTDWDATRAALKKIGL
jgi:hypothetical protein